MDLLQRPCCDYFTLEQRRAWDICPVCYWEDDRQDFGSLDELSGCNRGLTLRQGRENFRRIGACEPEFVECVRSAEERHRYRHGPR